MDEHIAVTQLTGCPPAQLTHRILTTAGIRRHKTALPTATGPPETQIHAVGPGFAAPVLACDALRPMPRLAQMKLWTMAGVNAVQTIGKKAYGRVTGKRDLPCGGRGGFTGLGKHALGQLMQHGPGLASGPEGQRPVKGIGDGLDAVPCQWLIADGEIRPAQQAARGKGDFHGMDKPAVRPIPP